MVSQLVIFILLSVCWTQLQLLTNAQVKEGTYIISTNGNCTRKLSLRANPPMRGQRLGNVEPRPSNFSAPFRWTIKKESWLYSLTPAENTKNFISDKNSNGPRGYEFTSKGNGTYLIEYVENKLPNKCLKNNGEGKSVSFVDCRAIEEPPKMDSSFLWNFQGFIHIDD